jgi:hypothetical protein
MARATDSTNRYRRAWQAGRDGHSMPNGLGDLADNDPKIDAAYQHGQGGNDFESFSSENGLDAPSSPAPKRRSSLGTAVDNHTPSLHVSPAADAATVIISLFVVAMVLSIVDYGPTGPLLWFKAKFLNEPATKPGAAPATAPSNVVPIKKKKAG